MTSGDKNTLCSNNVLFLPQCQVLISPSPPLHQALGEGEQFGAAVAQGVDDAEVVAAGDRIAAAARKRGPALCLIGALTHELGRFRPTHGEQHRRRHARRALVDREGARALWRQPDIGIHTGVDDGLQLEHALDR